MQQSAPLSPKAGRVESYVLDSIGNGRFPPGSTLPTIRQLTRMIGVSHVTVWKALRNLCERGVLVSIPGQLVQVAATAMESPLASSPLSSVVKGDSGLLRSRRRHWSSVARQIEQDILSGRFEPGTDLPSMKRLQEQYRTTYRTLSKALAALSDQGSLRLRGIGYTVPRLSSTVPGGAIVFLAEKSYFESSNLGLQQGHNYLDSMEVDASMASVRVILAPCVYRDDQLVAENPAAAFPSSGKKGPAILGYIYLLNHPDPSRVILESCARAGKPVAILDESGRSWTPPDGAQKFFRVFPVACTPLAGKVMGRYLLELGHRRVAYFSVYGAFPWSIARLQGVEESFRLAGLEGGVARFALDSDTWWFESRSSAKPAPRTSGNASGTQAGAPFQGAHAAKILTALQTLYSDTKSIERHLESMLEAALRDPSITAWVTENDEIAVLAAGFLRHRGVPIPQRLSLVSFDNSSRAVAGRITSYNFGIPAISHRAVRHIVEFSAGRRRDLPLRVELEGLIVERDSSRRCPV